MVIRKGNKEYTITERRECWVLSCTIGGLSVEYKVPKDICNDEKELRKNCFKGEDDGGKKKNKNFCGGEEPL